MTDINLLQDREAGEEKQEQEEKARRKSDVFVELTNPRREALEENTEKPGTSFWSFLKGLFTGQAQPKPSVSEKPRILVEKRAEPVSERPAAKRTKKIQERYAENTPGTTGLEDVFAPPPPPAPEEQPAGITPGAPTAAAQTSPDLTGASFQGNVNVPPTVPTGVSGAASQAGSGQPPVPPPTPGQPPAEPGSEDASAFLGVNLVPEEMMTNVNRQNRFVVLGFIAVIAALIVGLFYVGLSYYQSKIVNDTQAKKEEIASLDQELRQLNTKRTSATAFHALTQQTLDLLDQHVYWTKFFAGLEKYTLQTVSIRSVSADKTGHMTLTLSARDFRSVAQQIIAFRNATDFVKEVIINAATHTSVQGGIDSVDFTATVTLDPGVFYRDSSGGPTYSIEE